MTYQDSQDNDKVERSNPDIVDVKKSSISLVSVNGKGKNTQGCSLCTIYNNLFPLEAVSDMIKKMSVYGLNIEGGTRLRQFSEGCILVWQTLFVSLKKTKRQRKDKIRTSHT